MCIADPKRPTKEVDRVKMVKAASISEAAELRVAFERELRKEQLVSKLPSLLGDVVDKWWNEIKQRRHTEDPEQLHLCNATQKRYEGSAYQFIKPFFGDFDVAMISEDDVRRWRDNLVTSGYKRSTVNRHHRVLKTILRWAGTDVGAKVPELNERLDARITRKEPNLLTPDELDRFLEVARKDWPQHYALILVLFTTTMRLSTALALRIDDIDLETMELVVTRRLSEGVETPGVKRDRFGEDLPPCLPEVFEALKAHWSAFNEAQKASGLMFPAQDGRYHSRSVLRKAFEDILEKAKITKRFTPHGCRRTGAKLYGKTAGTRIAMEIAGHKTVRMHEHYAPTSAEEKQAAARSAFGGLRLVEGGETGTRTGTIEVPEKEASCKSAESK